MTHRIRSSHRRLRYSILVASLLVPVYAAAQQPAAGPQVYSVQHGSVREIANRIEASIDGTEERAGVYVDEKRRRLIVDGGPAVQQIALQMLQTLDRPAAPANAAASTSEMSVEGYAVPPQQLDMLTGALKRDFPGVRIAKDARLNQIVVVAPRQQQAQISAWLSRQVGNTIQPLPGQAGVPLGSSQTQAVPRSTKVVSTTLELRDIRPDALVHYVSQTLAGRGTLTETSGGAVAQIDFRHPDGNVKISVDKMNRRVSMTGPEHLLTSWNQVFRVLDQRPVLAREATRMVSLEQSQPNDIRHAMHLLRQAAQVERGMTSAAIPLRNDGEPLMRVAAQPGQDDAGQDNTPNTPQDPIEGEPAEQEDLDSGLIGDVRIEFVPELGIIVLRGRERDVERVRRIIQQIEDTADIVKPEIEIVYLKHLSNQSATALIVELYDEVFAPRQGPLSITALDKPNAILLIGGKQAMVVVKDLITKLDQPVTASTQMRVFRLVNMAATEAQTLVSNFFSDQPSADGGGGEPRPGLGTRGRVVADARTNSLIVQAGPNDMESIALFIEKLDKARTERVNMVQIFRLQNTLAAELAPVLQGALRGEGTTAGGVGAAGGAATAGAVSLMIQRMDAEEQKIIGSGILSDVTVSADATVNALIVTTHKNNMELIAELIRQLDQPPEAETMVKVFQIENGDATTTAQILQLLFGQQVTAGQGSLGTTLGQAFGAQQTSSGESSLIPLRIVPETRTNSIIVSGTKGDLNVVEILLLRLDTDSANSRRMAVYKLMNAPALDIANTITTMLSSQRQLIQQQFQTNQFVSPYQQFESEIIVVPELVTNSLVISATPQYYEQIIKIIEELDYQPPSVMVQCMICEVELTDEFEFGVELGLQDSLLFDRGVVLGNTTTLTNLTQGNLLAGQAVSSFNLGRSSASTGYGGMVLSAGNESVNILVRALQDAGRLQVLSRPSVMALNNQVAVVQVGALVPRITGVNTTPQGGIQNQTTDADVGLLLRIQPRINDDGLVTMIVDVERSDLGAIADGIPIAVADNGQVINSPQINTTTAQTTISAYSGQTVTFAGLIQKNRAVTSRRIPLISDIPVVGRLFRFDAESQTRRELLIFLTPHVMYDKADTDTLNYVESERMSWCLSDIVEMHGDVGMSGGHGLWGPPIAPMIYPDENPTHIGPTPAYEGGVQGEVVPSDIIRSNSIHGQTIDGHPIRGDVIEGVPMGGTGSGLSEPAPAGDEFGAQRLPRILPADGHPRTQTARAATPDRTSSVNQLFNSYDPRAVQPANYAPTNPTGTANDPRTPQEPYGQTRTSTGNYGTILR